MAENTTPKRAKRATKKQPATLDAVAGAIVRAVAELEGVHGTANVVINVGDRTLLDTHLGSLEGLDGEVRLLIDGREVR